MQFRQKVFLSAGMFHQRIQQVHLSTVGAMGLVRCCGKMRFSELL
jgi:hypothetical protein